MNTKDLKLKFQKLFRNYWPFLAIFLIAVTFFYPVWFQKKIPLPIDALVGAHIPWTEVSWEGYPAGIPIKNLEITDSISQFYPWRSLVGDFWRAGKVPLWNQYMFSGTPFLATLHSAALYPLNAFYLFLSNASAWTSLVFSQILLAGIFMYLFLRTLKLEKEASFLGAIAFSFSGYMISWLEFATGGQAGLWLPLLLLFEYKLVDKKKTIWLLPITTVFFFIFSAGDFQVPFYISLTYLLFGSFLLKNKGFSFKKSFKSYLTVFSGLIFGLLVSLPQLLPTIDLFTRSVRLDDPYISEYFYGLMHWEKVVNFVWPDFFGNVVTGNYWGKFGFHEYMSYAGTVTLVYAIYSLFGKKEKTEKFFWFLTITSLLFLFPTPLGFLPFKLKIPGLGTSSASRIIFLVEFCLATLAAYGFSKWQKEKRPKILKVIYYLLIVTLGVGFGLIISFYLASTSFVPAEALMINLKVALKNMIPSTLILIVLGLLFVFQSNILFRVKNKSLSKRLFLLILFAVLGLSSLDLLRFAFKNTPFSPPEFLYPETQTLKYLQEKEKPFRIAGGIPLNLFVPFQISSVEGYDPIYPSQNAKWFSAVNYGNEESPSGRYGQVHSFSSPLINYANVKYVVDYKRNIYGYFSDIGNYSFGIEDPRFQAVYTEGRVSIFENTEVFPRVFLSTNYKVEDSDQDVIDSLISQNTGEEIIILNKEPETKINKEALDYEVKEFKQEYNTIEIRVKSSVKSLLFLSESFYPGWKAFVDGEETQILRANYLFQSIILPEGEHNIVFIYRPKPFSIGVKVLVVSLLVLVTYSFKKKVLY